MDELPLYFHPDASQEAQDAYEWYLVRSHHIAEAFREALEAAGNAIRQSPQRWPEYLFETRVFAMKRFPFAVVYRARENRIEIIAVAHTSRRPEYWVHRTPGN